MQGAYHLCGKSVLVAKTRHRDPTLNLFNLLFLYLTEFSLGHAVAEEEDAAGERPGVVELKDAQVGLDHGAQVHEHLRVEARMNCDCYRAR